MRSSGQFILGFLIGVALLAAGVAGATYVFLSSMAYNPPKPVFSEESKPPKAETKTTKTNQPSAQPTEESQAEPEPEPEPEEELPSGAYRATVNWSEGLSIRAEPEQDAERIGGVEYNREVIVLKESGDRNWQQIRIPGSEQEGWVKAGNVEKITE